MSKTLDAIKLGASSYVPPGAGAFARMRYWAANTQGENYFGSNYSMNNLVIGNGSEGFFDAFSTPYQTSDYWLAGVPAGQNYSKRIVFNLDPNVGFFPPGNYKVSTQQGMYCTVTNVNGSSFMHITQQGNSSTTQSVRDATFTIDDLGPSGNYGSLYIIVTVYTPGTGGPYGCNDLYVGLVSDYAGWLAGNYNSAAYTANYTSVAAVKSADLVGMNNGDNPVKFMTRSDQMVPYTRSFQGTGFRSYGLFAKQCYELDTICWPVLPVGYETYFFSASVANNSITRGAILNCTVTPRSVGDTLVMYGGYFQDGVPHGGVQGGVLYYIVQVVGPDEFRLSLTPGGTPITITSDFTAGDYNAQIAYVFDPYPLFKDIFIQMKTAAPNVLIAPQTGLENWNSNYFYELRRQVSSVQAGTPYNAGYGYGYGTMRMWKALLEVFPRSQCVLLVDSWGLNGGGFATLGNALDYVSTDPTFNFGKKISDLLDCMSTNAYPHFNSTNDNWFDVMVQGAIGWTPSQWSTATRLAIDQYAISSAQWRTALDAKRPHTPAVMYECGLGEGMFGPNGFPSANATVSVVNTGTPGSLTATWPFGGPWLANMPLAVTSTGTVPAGLTQPYVYVHSSSTATNLVVSLTRGGSPAAITSAGSGTIRVAVNGPQLIDLGNSYEAYLASTQYAQDIKYFLDNVIRSGFKAQMCADYCVDGGWGKGQGSLIYWGKKRAAQVPDTPAVTLFKNYTDYVFNP